MPFNTSVLNSVHGRIHRSEMFSSCDAFSLGNAETKYYLIRTTSVTAHFSYSISANAELQIKLLKEITLSDEGNALERINANDIILVKPVIVTVETFKDATLSDDGTDWEVLLLTGGSGTFAQGDTLGTRIEEHILKTTAEYAIKITNPNIAGVVGSINMGWYEPQ